MKLPNINSLGITGGFIAGGAVLSTVTKTPINDYDIYPKTKEDLVEICMELFSQAQMVNLSERAVTFKSYKEHNSEGERQLIQVIRGEFPTPESIFDNFDFTVCMGAYDCDTDQYTFHENFWPDVASKTLRFNSGTKFPLNSLIRTYKYTQKGYKTSKTEMAKIALTVASKGMPMSWEELEEEIGGTYGRSLKLAREGEEFTFDKAVEVLSDITDESFEGYTEDGFTDFSEAELKLILKGTKEPVVVYKLPESSCMFGGNYVQVDEQGFVSGSEVSDKLKDYGVTFEIKNLSDIEYISAWKQLKLKDGSYIGGVYNGHHNGVTYKPYQETRYELGECLFCYVSEVHITKSSGMFKAQVKVPTKDIVSIDSAKIKTKSMICMEIT